MGDIYVGDIDVTDKPPQERDIAMVFQNYALYPHMTVRDNLAYGLKLRKMPKAAWRQRWTRWPRRWASTSSSIASPPRSRAGSGSASRWAARSCASRSVPDGRAALEPRRQAPRLDARRAREAARPPRRDDRLRHARPGRGDDARSAVAVLRDGLLQQLDTPHTLFHSPANLFVAAFIGSPSMNLVDAEIDGDVVASRVRRRCLLSSLVGEAEGDPRDPSDGLRSRRPRRPTAAREGRGRRRRGPGPETT